MLDELRKVIPSFLQRVDLPDRGGEWSAYLAVDPRRHGACRGAPLARRRTRSARDRRAGDDRRRRRGDAPRLRPRRRGEGPGRGLFLATSPAPSARRPARVRRLGHDERVALLRAYVGDRRNRRHRPGRAFERTDYRFELVTDYGAFRDLQRHRMLTHRVAAARHRARLRHARARGRRRSRRALRRGDRPGRGPLPLPCDRTSPSRRRTPSRWPTASATSCSSTRARRCTSSSCARDRRATRPTAGWPADAPGHRRGGRPPRPGRGDDVRRPRRHRPRAARIRAPGRAPRGRKNLQRIDQELPSSSLVRGHMCSLTTPPRVA